MTDPNRTYAVLEVIETLKMNAFLKNNSTVS